MLQVTGDGFAIAGLGVTVRGAAAVRFDSSSELRLLCGLLLDAAATAGTCPGPGDAYLRAKGWDPEEFHRVGGVEQLQLYDLLRTDAVFWSRYETVSESRLPLIFDRFLDAEPGSFEELLVATTALAMDAEPDLGGLHGLMAIAPPLAEEPVESWLCFDEERDALVVSPELPLPCVVETRDLEVPGWLLCLIGDPDELQRLAEAMCERRLLAESFH